MRRIKTIGFVVFWTAVSLALIFFIAAIGVLNRFNSQESATQMEVDTLAKACQLYRLNVGEFPSSLDLLFEKPDNLSDEQWNGPYLDKRLRNDPWLKPFLLEVNQAVESVTVRSVGPDGMKNTEDDICTTILNRRDD